MQSASASVAPEVTRISLSSRIRGRKALRCGGQGLPQHGHALHRRILVGPFDERPRGGAANRLRAVFVGKALTEIDRAMLARQGRHDRENRGALSGENGIDACVRWPLASPEQGVTCACSLGSLRNYLCISRNASRTLVPIMPGKSGISVVNTSGTRHALARAKMRHGGPFETDEMKKIEAIIKPFKLDEVKEALQEIGVSGHHGHRGQGLRPAEGPHGTLPRRGICRRLSCPR